MLRILLFILLSLPVVIISWRSIFSFNNHGFYRFVSWECILWLLISNITFWFENWYSVPQIISWILLCASLPILYFGVHEMKYVGKKDQNRDNSLYRFEKTSELVKSGIFAYIRHPLYSSLLLLTWGVFLKHIDLILLIITVVGTITIFLTAKMEEKENVHYFGDSYRHYLKKTKMFVPFVF
jgi:protein-S-isoprenylcysteine O-methyltransferase Ste14